MKYLSMVCLIISTVSSTQAADFGVNLEWTTQDFQKVAQLLPKQRNEFTKLVERGEIKDMFLLDSEIDGKPIKILRFVIEAEDEKEVESKLKHLPLYEQNLVKIKGIRNLGTKWLDNTPIYNNYSATLTWQKDVDRMEMDRVLATDLQKVITLNQSGFVTSAYLNTQQINETMYQPIYSVAMLAKDDKHALELSKQFEAVRLGYAKVEVLHLGLKLDINNLEN